MGVLLRVLPSILSALIDCGQVCRVAQFEMNHCFLRHFLAQDGGVAKHQATSSHVGVNKEKNPLKHCDTQQLMFRPTKKNNDSEKNNSNIQITPFSNPQKPRNRNRQTLISAKRKILETSKRKRLINLCLANNFSDDKNVCYHCEQQRWHCNSSRTRPSCRG
jgi:hypothetical protein